jgi:SAM-dependent methyltransferase
MPPTTIDYLIYLKNLLVGQLTTTEKRITHLRHGDVSPYLDLNSCLKILDLANGRLRPQYYLLKTAGHNVTGIDLANDPRTGKIDFAYNIARWLFNRHVPQQNRRMSPDSLVCGDVAHLPFADDYFDLVTSVAAFEHFLDVPAVVSELKRVLRPGGILWVGIHIFTSPSGGHYLGFTEIPLRNIPPGVDPWDHLRKKRFPPLVPLNQWRLSQYLDVFSENFEILKHYCITREGEHLLTPEIESELSDYSRAELTNRTTIIIARKS